MKDLKAIKQVFVYPGIGIARVGDSPNEYFLAPEIMGAPITDKNDFRDKSGRIKRQAQRFRLFGADAKGKIIKELTAKDGDITWDVHVANKKTAWYDFDLALDIPAAKGEISGYPVLESNLRNPQVPLKDRKRLIIDGGNVTISGTNTNKTGKSDKYAFNKGTFYNPKGKDTPVYLGELRTDEDGNLLFLGGRGLSASYNNTPATTFANNQTWHDDTSDGSVDATITLKDGRTIKANGGWVMTTPPNYAPGIQAYVTGYELLFQTAIDAGQLSAPKKPSFFADVWPILNKMPLNQWVNKGVAIVDGWGSPMDFSNPQLMKKLANNANKQLDLRTAIFERFRNPNYEVIQAEYLPPLYGDGVESFASSDTDPRNFMAVLPYQYTILEQWAKGNFKEDKPTKPKTWDKMTPAEKAYNLDAATLNETLGGPFHPGCEFTWPMRHTMMYSSPFRIKRRPDAPLVYADVLNSKIALAKGGPLDGSSPGDITRWMAVPWQTDTSSCLSGYVGIMGEYIPTFWPARVPNDVLAEEDYQVVMQKSGSVHDKVAAFTERKKWLRGVVYEYGYPPVNVSPYTKGINEFINAWHKVGIVVEKEGPATKELPDKIWVETGRSIPPPKKALKKSAKKAAPAMDAGWLWMIDRAKKRKK
jgi:hypothetical protein